MTAAAAGRDMGSRRATAAIAAIVLLPTQRK
jgi:hypothetical protein